MYVAWQVIYFRFAHIIDVLASLNETRATTKSEALAQNKRDFAVNVSTAALFILTDLCHLSHDAKIVSAARHRVSHL